MLGVLLKRNIVEKWRRMFILPYIDFTYEVEHP
jgi:glycyl-tRNA synthetase (EC 6.1.1.14)